VARDYLVELAEGITLVDRLKKDARTTSCMAI
jgi:hypothetical protein